MIVAVASLGNSLESLVSPCFRTAKYIILIDVKDGEILRWEALTNQEPRGPFISHLIDTKNIEAFICGNYGSGVLQILKSKGVKTLITAGKSVKEAAILAESGNLNEI